MKFYTYILFSDKLGKYYIGSTGEMDRRLAAHNNGWVKFTSMGTPWILIWNKESETRKEAVQLENKIKKRGAKRYLMDIGHGQPE